MVISKRIAIICEKKQKQYCIFSLTIRVGYNPGTGMEGGGNIWSCSSGLFIITATFLERTMQKKDVEKRGKLKYINFL
jgi:hypothetical protein